MIINIVWLLLEGLPISSTCGSLPHHFPSWAVEEVPTSASLSLNTTETNKMMKNYSILLLGCVEPLGSHRLS